MFHQFHKIFTILHFALMDFSLNLLFQLEVTDYNGRCRLHSLNIIFLSCRLCLIHGAEVRWVKPPMVDCMRFFNKTMGLLALLVLKLPGRTLSLAALVMQLPAFYFNQRIGTMGIFFLTSMLNLLTCFFSVNFDL